MAILDNTASLLFRINADSSNAEAELKRFGNAIGREVTGTSQTAQAAVKNLTDTLFSGGSAISGFAGPAGIAALAVGAIATAATGAASALLDLAEKGSAFGEKIYEASVKTGLSTESVSALSLAANSAGIEFSKLEPGLIIFEKLLGNAADGAKKATRVLANIGIDSKTGFQDLEGSLNTVFLRAQTLGTAVERTKLFTSAFGRSGAEMAKIYDETGGNLAAYTKELEKAGLTLSGADTAGAHEFQKAMRELKYEFDIIIVAFVKDFLPPLTAGLKSIGDYLKENKSTFSDWGTGITDTIRGVGIEWDRYGKKVAEVLGGTVGQILSQNVEANGGWASSITKILGGTLGFALKSAGEDARASDAAYAAGDGRMKQTGKNESGGYNLRTGPILTSEQLAAIAAEYGFVTTPGGGNRPDHRGHTKGSKHYLDEADDVRTKTHTPAELAAFKEAMRTQGIYVLDETSPQKGSTGPHFHLEDARLVEGKGKPYVGAEDEEKAQKAREKEANKEYRAQVEDFKNISKDELEAHRDRLEKLKEIHDKEASDPKKVFADSVAENNRAAEEKIANIKKEKDAYQKLTGSLDEKPEDADIKLKGFDTQIKDALTERDRQNRQLKTELHKSELELSKRHFDEREALQKELDARQIAAINDSADKEGISYKAATEAVFKIREDALARQKAQLNEETRINKAGGDSKTTQNNIDKEAALNYQASENLRVEKLKASRESEFKDNQRIIDARIEQNKLADEDDKRHYAALQSDLDNFLITKRTFAEESAKIDEAALLRQIAVKRAELENNINNPKEYARITGEIAVLDKEFTALREADARKITAATKETTAAMEAQTKAAQESLRQTQNEAASVQIRGLQNAIDNGGADGKPLEENARIDALERIRQLKLAIIKSDYDAATAQDARDKRAEQDEVKLFDDKAARLKEIDARYAAIAKNRAATLAADKKDVSNETEQNAGLVKSVSLLDQIHKGFTALRQDASLQGAGNTLKAFGAQMVEVFSNMKAALQSSIEQWLLYGGSIGKALKQALAEQLAHVASMAAIKALEATALGFLDLAYGNFAGASHAFTSAALWGALAIGAGVGASALATGSQSAQTATSASGGGSASASSTTTVDRNTAITTDQGRNDGRGDNTGAQTIYLSIPRGMVQQHVMDDFNNNGVIRTKILKLVNG